MANERTPINILMIDDQPGKLLSYEVILRELDENLIKAHSAREAFEQLLKNDIAVVLMDVSMPEIDGFELADMIRQHPRFQRTAIIFISAVHLTELDQLKAYQRGAVDYISVPIVPELLRAKVSIFVDLYRKTLQMEQLNNELRALSLRLMSVQDEERRRIARELHDSSGQVVAALLMNNGLALSQVSTLNPTVREALRQNDALLQQLSKEIRTVSHLLHPPLLDEIGLLPAIRTLADGFAERSNIKVEVELAPQVGRLTPYMEISVFRIVQECLTNVHRHSGSNTAFVSIGVTDDKVLTVQVRDEGKGVSPGIGVPKSPATRGVGLRGMRERVKELGGELNFQSGANGTTVTAQFPVNAATTVGV